MAARRSTTAQERADSARGLILAYVTGAAIAACLATLRVILAW